MLVVVEELQIWNSSVILTACFLRLLSDTACIPNWANKRGVYVIVIS